MARLRRVLSSRGVGRVSPNVVLLKLHRALRHVTAAFDARVEEAPPLMGRHATRQTRLLLTVAPALVT